MSMEKSVNWTEVRDNTTNVRPLTISDFGAKIIDNATKAEYPKTPEILKCYNRLSNSIISLDEVTKANCAEDEITDNKKAVYTSYNELVNEIQNYLNSHDDADAKFHLRQLVLEFGSYRK